MNNARNKTTRKTSTGRPCCSMIEGLESRQFMSASLILTSAAPVYAPADPCITADKTAPTKTGTTIGDIHIVRQLDKSSVKLAE